MVKPLRNKHGKVIGWGVFHGHPKKPGSKTDKAKGALIHGYYGKGAHRKASKMHNAIGISKARAAGHHIPGKR